MRYIILGSGAIGGAIGGRLHQSGKDVLLVARGENYRVLAGRGLELRDPERTTVLDIPVVGAPEAARPQVADVVILATKTQHSQGALAALAAVAPASIAVICAQNGVENERLALRQFGNVYGMRVILAGTHLDPGVVEIATAPLSGVLDVGRYPRGSDELARTVVGDLCRAGFDAEAPEDVMRHKYLKLLSNLGNSIEAACGTRWPPTSAGGPAPRLVRATKPPGFASRTRRGRRSAGGPVDLRFPSAAPREAAVPRGRASRGGPAISRRIG